MIRPRDDVEHNADEEETQTLFQADLEDEEDEDAKGYPHLSVDSQSLSVSRVLSFDQEDEHDPRPSISGLGNARARVSRIDIIPSPLPSAAHAQGDTVTSSGSGSKSVRGLSAQAGAIIVRDHLVVRTLSLTRTLFLLPCVNPGTGCLQGIHNMFIVVPQFLVTGLASIIFALIDPQKSVLHGHHAGNTQGDAVGRLLTRSDEARPDSTVIIFRFVFSVLFLIWYFLNQLV